MIMVSMLSIERGRRITLLLLVMVVKLCTARCLDHFLVMLAPLGNVTCILTSPTLQL